jgi:hypothetical protein
VDSRRNGHSILLRSCDIIRLMLFRPKFCTNCGSRIERETWLPWTSRRFCETCEIEFKGREWLLRFAVGITLLIGVVGFGTGWFAGARTPEPRVSLKGEKPEAADKESKAAPPATDRGTTSSLAANPAQRTEGREPQPAPLKQAASAPPPVQQPFTAESVYHCGAETRKGTPCSRRVKDPNTRCYQHAGMPAMGGLEAKSATKRR